VAEFDFNLSQRFAKNLSLHRHRMGVSQEELGFQADLHRTEIGQLERGARLPRLDTIAKLAGALEVDHSELFHGINWRPGYFAGGSFDVSGD
jgi:transcriptional regulator with XRE-family HTH domain